MTTSLHLITCSLLIFTQCKKVSTKSFVNIVTLLKCWKKRTLIRWDTWTFHTHVENRISCTGFTFMSLLLWWCLVTSVPFLPCLAPLSSAFTQSTFNRSASLSLSEAYKQQYVQFHMIVVLHSQKQHLYVFRNSKQSFLCVSVDVDILQRQKHKHWEFFSGETVGMSQILSTDWFYAGFYYIVGWTSWHHAFSHMQTWKCKTKWSCPK